MNKRTPENDEIDLLQLLLLPLKNYILIIVIAFVGAVIGYFSASNIVEKKYTSKASIYMQNSDNGNTTSSDLTAAGYFANDAKVMITSNTVLEETLSGLGFSMSISELKSEISIDIPSNTRWLNITVTDSDPVRAENIVNTLAKISAKYIVSVMGAKNAEVVDKGVAAKSPSSPSVKKWVLLGFALGFVLTYGVFILKNFLDDKIHTADDVTKYLELPVLASIPIEDIRQ